MPLQQPYFECRSTSSACAAQAIAEAAGQAGIVALGLGFILALIRYPLLGIPLALTKEEKGNAISLFSSLAGQAGGDISGSIELSELGADLEVARSNKNQFQGRSI